jgi:hypothetical protein
VLDFYHFLIVNQGPFPSCFRKNTEYFEENYYENRGLVVADPRGKEFQQTY